ncbi:MAG: tRNA (N(6)-L-threonylcarbamoyladenosine(37)-C(2))-methylthiotransferase MtaB [Flavobacteriales bacterium]
MKRVAFYTLGCKLNFSETSTIARLFENEGFQKVDFDDQPDIYVINTCSVTDNADKKCRSLVNKAMRISPHAYVAVIGCYAQLKPQEIANIHGVDLVLGANEKFNILQHIREKDAQLQAKVHACEIDTVKRFNPSWSVGDRTRSFFKVQDGCDYSCSFCTIPLARGESRSASIAETIENARKLLAANDVKELVLTGVNTGDFGKKNKENFFGLIQELDRLDRVERIRISSIEPNLLSDKIIEFVAGSNKFVPHFHIPLQSGSDKILRLMRRRYQRQLYVERVAKIKSLMPHCCIGVDVIVGFPGETKDDFIETYEFLRDLDISYLHVFTYSERANTHAISLDGVVPAQIRAERSKMLHILSDKKRRAFYEAHLGQTREVLFEAEQEGDMMHGFTDNYIKVQIPFDLKYVNKTHKVYLKGIAENGIFDVIIKEPAYQTA